LQNVWLPPPWIFPTVSQATCHASAPPAASAPKSTPRSCQPWRFPQTNTVHREFQSSHENLLAFMTKDWSWRCTVATTTNCSSPCQRKKPSKSRQLSRASRCAKSAKSPPLAKFSWSDKTHEQRIWPHKAGIHSAYANSEGSLECGGLTPLFRSQPRSRSIRKGSTSSPKPGCPVQSFSSYRRCGGADVPVCCEIFPPPGAVPVVVFVGAPPDGGEAAGGFSFGAVRGSSASVGALSGVSTIT
jgi:hypothetical protein